MNALSQLLHRLARLEDRVAKTVMLGMLAEIDSARGRARATIGELNTDWLPYALPAASAGVSILRTPQAGEQCVIMCPDGELDNGVIVCGFATGDSAKTAQPEGDLRIVLTGDAVIEAANVQIAASGDATITATTATVKTTGDATIDAENVEITASGDAVVEGNNIEITARPPLGKVKINGGGEQCLGQLTPCLLTGGTHIPNPLIRTSIS